MPTPLHDVGRGLLWIRTMQLLMGNANSHPQYQPETNMIKKKRTTNGQGTLKTKLPESATPKYQYPDNNSQADNPAVDARADAKEQSDGTHQVEFLAVGASGDGDRFLKRRVGSDVDLISVAKLISDPTAEYVRLQRAGLPLLRRAARNQFTEQAEIEASKEPTFLVATQPGLHQGRVCLPGDAVSASHSDVEFYPDERHAPVYEKFLRVGDYQGWTELVSLSRGNSRLILAYQLAFSGLVCAAFGLDPPDALFC